MPCNDGPNAGPWDGARAERLEAMLCGVMRAAELEGEAGGPDVLARYDGGRAGVPRRELEHWWRLHRAADEQRRRREEAEPAESVAREGALVKLTPEERRLLGGRVTGGEGGPPGGLDAEEALDRLVGAAREALSSRGFSAVMSRYSGPDREARDRLTEWWLARRSGRPPGRAPAVGGPEPPPLPDQEAWSPERAHLVLADLLEAIERGAPLLGFPPRAPNAGPLECRRSGVSHGDLLAWWNAYQAKERAAGKRRPAEGGDEVET